MPRVCIQVPAYDEPVELVRQTLKPISRLDYGNFHGPEVVDNTTTDPALWESPSPVPSPRSGVTPSPSVSSHPAPTSAPTGRPTSTPSPHR